MTDTARHPRTRRGLETRAALLRAAEEVIGARGVGETVLLGLQRNDSGEGLVGGIVIVLLAVVIDRITQSYGTRLQAYRRAGE